MLQLGIVEYAQSHRVVFMRDAQLSLKVAVMRLAISYFFVVFPHGSDDDAPVVRIYRAANEGDLN